MNLGALGMTCDKKLTFSAHIKKKCMKSLNLTNVIAHRTSGEDKETLHKVYISVITSKVDYSGVVYGSARSSV